MLIVTIMVVVAAILFIARGADVRLVLFVAALLLGTLAQQPVEIIRTFFVTFSSEKFVVPICCAMGFAYVLRHTECDQHLVQLLIKPLRSVRVLLIPGVILVGFVVNIPVISQTSTAVCIGPVIVPLMRAAGIPYLTIGSALLLGASIGGELLNPGAPELLTVSKATHTDTRVIVGYVLPLVMVHLTMATLLFWCFAKSREDEIVVVAESAPVEFKVNLFRAMVPMIPVVLLFMVGPPFYLLPDTQTQWLREHLLNPKDDPKAFESRLIGLAMLIGCVCALMSNPRKTGGVAKAFFDGAGYAFTHVVSLIVIATCFAKGIELCGLAERLKDVIEQFPNLMWPIAGALPLCFGALSGFGMASTQGLFGFFVAPAQSLHMNPDEVGALVSLAAAAGRTLSPVAAVTLMCATLTNTSPFALMRRVAPPLIISMTLLVIFRMLGIL